MKLLIILLYVLALLFAKWLGKPFQAILRYCASNPYVAVLLCGLLFLGIIRIFNYLSGEMELYGARNVFRSSKPRTTHTTKRKE